MSIRKKQSFFILLFVVAALLLNACERSASSSPSDSAANTNETQVFDYFLAAATETAQAVNQAEEPEEMAQAEEPEVEEPTLPPPTEAQPEPTKKPTAEPEKEEEQEPEKEPKQEKATPTAEPTKEEKVKEITPLPTSEVSVPKTYTLKKGESPFCIARRFDIDINAILDTNGLWLNQYYEAGLELTLPKNAEKFDGERQLMPHPDTYVVQKGDTFYTIACDFGNIYPVSIAEANGMETSDDLEAGESIFIP